MTDQTNPPIRTCIGCARTLPVDGDHFYGQVGGDGFTARCKECVKAVTRRRQAAIRERKAAERAALPTKKCTGRCGRTLPLDAEHFHRHAQNRNGFHSRCRNCATADRRERRAAERPPPARPAPSPENAALVVAAAALDELIAELTGERPRHIGNFSRDRLRLVQRRAEMTPRDHGAADRARQLMVKADEAVREQSFAGCANIADLLDALREELEHS